MPAEPTQKKLKRRASRKDLDEHSSLRFDGTHGRELELKRNRGEVSCAECRRLKIKCDKQIPCQSCQRRGCSALCPNGSLATGQGTRFVLAATEHLHRRIARLSGRIRQLEDALSTLHAKHSNSDEPHPLLHEDLIRAEVEESMAEGGGSYYPDESGDANFAATAGSGAAGPSSHSAGGNGHASSSKTEGGTGPVTEILPAFGTLSISEHGISRFFGPTGGSESLLLAHLDREKSTPPPSQAPHTPESQPGSKSPGSFISSSQSPPSSSQRSASNATTGGTPDGTTSSTGTAPGLSRMSPGTINQLQLFSAAFPFTPMGAPSHIITLILSHLPSYERTLEICETFFVQAAWLFRGVTRGQLLDEMVPKIYGRLRESGIGTGTDSGMDGGPRPDTDAKMHYANERAQDASEDEQEEYAGPHDLALLFIILAVGSLVAPEADGPEGQEATASQDTKESSSSAPASASRSTSTSTSGSGRTHFASSQAEAQALGAHFHQLARAAVALQPVLEKPSYVTIQVLHLMSIYNAMSGSDVQSETSMELTWSLVTLASHLSQTIGLHRDSARWGLSEKMVQRRRILFWDLFVADVWQGLNTGRPPSFSVAYIDCAYPQYSNEAGFATAFEKWQCKFAAECVADVTARTLTAEAPSYATIMELDRKVREFPLPEGLDSAPSDDIAASFQRCVLEHIRETVLMYIHRSFFAQAIIEHPVNPLKSDYAASFIAAYRASSIILKSVREQFQAFPNTCPRFWTMWTFAFSAAVVFGTVVTRGPKSPLARSAMTELEQACVLFSKASQYSIRASKALVILAKLSEKARVALAAAQHDPSPMPGDRNGLLWNIKSEEDEDDELSIIAGHTRFVSARNKPADSAHPAGAALPPPPLSAGVGSQMPHLSTRMVEPIPIDLRQPHQHQPQHQLQAHHQISRQPSNISLGSDNSASSLSGSASGMQSSWSSIPPSHDTAYMDVVPAAPSMDYGQSRYAPSSSSQQWTENYQQAAACSQTHLPQQQGQSYPDPRQQQHDATSYSHQPTVQPLLSTLTYSYHPDHAAAAVQGGHPQEQPVSHRAQHRHQQHVQARDRVMYQEQYPQAPISSSEADIQQPHSAHSHSESYPQAHYAQAQYHSRHQLARVPSHDHISLQQQQHMHQSQSDRMYQQQQQQPHQYQYQQQQSPLVPSSSAAAAGYAGYTHGGMAPAYQAPAGEPPNMGLSEMGLAARDSRLDERWGSFMADSGLLEDFRSR